MQDLKQYSDSSLYHSKNEPVFEVITHRKDVEFIQTTDTVVLVYVIDGEINFSFDGKDNRTAGKSDIFMLPAGSEVSITFNKLSSLLYLYVSIEIDFCRRIQQKFAENPQPTSEQSVVLAASSVIQIHLNAFIIMTERGVSCLKYLNLQIKALFELICMEYPPESLIVFFAPLHTNTVRQNADFRNLVLQNRNKIFKVSDFVAAADMSRTTFRRYFERIFGMNPQDWITQERVTMIEEELTHGEMPLRHIATQAGFNSVREFYSYCRKKFGRTATCIRTGR
jgi:AraC-like DNA-binding protein